MNAADTLFKNLRAMRIHSHRNIEALTEEQLLRVPPGLHNNILWNIGHVITDEVNMLYLPAGLASPLPADYVSLFDPGTSPADWPTPPDVAAVLERSRAMTGVLISDYEARRFSGFEPYNLAESYRLETIEEAIAYHTIHEGMHIGANLTLRRLVT